GWDRIPTMKMKKGEMYDVSGVFAHMNELRDRWPNEGYLACIEKVHAFPLSGRGQNQGQALHMASNTKQFYCAGLFHGIMRAIELPYVEIHSISWKKKILEGLPGGKEAGMEYIDHRFPELNVKKLPKRDRDNVADAFCLALFAKTL
ncbi:MAG: hypothetical protein ACREOP_01850, partial [Thermodesulfobacteriota bacterium]